MRVLETSVLNYCLADTYEAKLPSSREAQACNAVQLSMAQIKWKKHTMTTSIAGDTQAHCWSLLLFTALHEVEVF